MPTEERKPAWRAACLTYLAKRREGASHQEVHEAAVVLRCIGRLPALG
jgi:hypothetical protein